MVVNYEKKDYCKKVIFLLRVTLRSHEFLTAISNTAPLN